MWRRILWAGYFLTLFVATHTPIPTPIADVVTFYDKMIHAGAYLVLALLTASVFLNRESPAWTRLLLAGVLMSYAALDEYLQGFVNRSPDVEDWKADTWGIVIGCLLTFPLRRWLPPAKASCREPADPRSKSPPPREPGSACDSQDQHAVT